MDITPEFPYAWECVEEDELKEEECIKDPSIKVARSRRETELPANVGPALFQRQIGLAYSTYSKKLGAHVHNQMTANRAPQDSSYVEIHTVSQMQPSRLQRGSEGGNMTNKWIRATMPTTGGSRQKIDVCGSYFMVKEPGINTRKFYSLNPFLGGNEMNQFQLEYEIKDQDKSRYKWRCHDVWSVSPSQQATTTGEKILKVPSTLFVLENRKLVLYDLHKGFKLKEQEITFPNAPAHYSYVAADDCNDLLDGCQVYVYGYKLEVSKANPGMIFEILVFDYPPLRAVFRILVPKQSSFGTFNSFSISGGQLLASKANLVESYDLKDVIFKNLVQLGNNSEPTTVILRIRCTPLLSVPTYRGVSEQISSFWPPGIVVRTKSSHILKRLDDLEGQIYAVESNKDGVAIKGLEGLLEPFVVVSGLPHGIDILQVDREGRGVQLLFSTKKTKEENPTCNGTPNGTAKGNHENKDSGAKLRPHPKIDYRDMEDSNTSTQYGCTYDYNAFLNLLAICEISNGYLNVLLLKCKVPPAPRDLGDGVTVPPPTLPIFKRLQPVKLTKPKGIKKVQYASMSAILRPSFLLINLRLFDASAKSGAYFEEMYIARLLGEYVP